MRSYVSVVALTLALYTAIGCRRDAAPPPPPPPPPPTPAPPSPPPAPPAPRVQWYRATVGSAPDEVPFLLGTPVPGEQGSCTIANGDERIDARCAWTTDALKIEFLEFATSITATRAADGALSGAWHVAPQLNLKEPVAFAAHPIAELDPTLRFTAPAATGPTGNFAGTWELHFEGFGLGKGVFTQTAGGVVTGTMIPTDIGDLRYLAGNALGNTLWLSTFDGQHAYVIHATLAANGALSGVWTYTKIMSSRFKGKRVDDLDVSRVETLRLRKGVKRVSIPQLSDPDLRGKPVIVDYSGSWCPACIDEMPFLVDLYRRYHAAGLEILSISVEGTTDDELNKRQIAYLRDHFKITWRIDILTNEFTDVEGVFPPELENLGGYPITLFINRDGTVRDVHSGFYGPAAGADYDRLRLRFEENVRAMLAQPAAAQHE